MARSKRPDDVDDESERSFELIGDRFIAAVRAMLRSSKRQMMERDLYLVDDRQLTPVQVLGLESMAERDQWRMRDIAEALGVDPSTASRTLAPLVDLGLAERFIDPGDRRQVIIRATKQGRTVCKRIAENRHQMMRNVLSKMAPERRILLTELFEEYVQAVENVEPRVSPSPKQRSEPQRGRSGSEAVDHFGVRQ